MGQPISVTRKPSTRPGIVRFEINRSLTGMGHERYRSPADVAGDRPPDHLARRLFEAGGDAVTAIHVYSNVITVETAGRLSDRDLGEMEDAVRSLYIHYKDGVQPSFSGTPTPTEASTPPSAP